MIVNVTEDHIKKGKRGSPGDCPIACALRDATGMHWLVSRVNIILFAHHLGVLRIPLSDSITRLIEMFDKTGKMASFSVYVPDVTPTEHQTTPTEVEVVPPSRW